MKAGEEVGTDAPLIRLGHSPATAASHTQAESALQVALAVIAGVTVPRPLVLLAVPALTRLTERA